MSSYHNLLRRSSNNVFSLSMPAWPTMSVPPICFLPCGLWSTQKKQFVFFLTLAFLEFLINLSSVTLQTPPLQIESLTWTCQSSMMKNHLQRSNNVRSCSLSCLCTWPSFPLERLLIWGLGWMIATSLLCPVTFPILSQLFCPTLAFLWSFDWKSGAVRSLLTMVHTQVWLYIACACAVAVMKCPYGFFWGDRNKN